MEQPEEEADFTVAIAETTALKAVRRRYIGETVQAYRDESRALEQGGRRGYPTRIEAHRQPGDRTSRGGETRRGCGLASGSVRTTSPRRAPPKSVPHLH